MSRKHWPSGAICLREVGSACGTAEQQFISRLSASPSSSLQGLQTLLYSAVYKAVTSSSADISTSEIPKIFLIPFRKVTDAQEIKMSSKRLEAATKFVDQYGTNNIEVLHTLLADDLTFDFSPARSLDNAKPLDKAGYIGFREAMKLAMTGYPLDVNKYIESESDNSKSSVLLGPFPPTCLNSSVGFIQFSFKGNLMAICSKPA